MRTTLDLPDALVNEIKVRAQHEGLKLNDAVAELLRKGLAASDEPQASAARLVIKTKPCSGLPYIECPPNAPARTMTAEELVALEGEILAREDRERTGPARRQ